jgi:hypothetical protein
MPIDIFDLYQHKRIWDAEERASSASRDISQVAEKADVAVLRLEAKIDALALICEAL